MPDCARAGLVAEPSAVITISSASALGRRLLFHVMDRSSYSQRAFANGGTKECQAATTDCNPRSPFQTGPRGQEVQERAKLDQGHSWAHLMDGGPWPASNNKSPSDRPERLSSGADRTDPLDWGSSPGRARRHGEIRHARTSRAQVPNSGRRDESWD